MSRASAFLVFFFFPIILCGAQIGGTPTVIVGWNQFDPAFSADGHPALLTRMGGITAVAIGADGLTLTAGRGLVRQIGADGLVRTLVTDQNMATQVKLSADRQGGIYYSVALGIKKRTPAGSIVAVAGGAGPGLPQEGAIAANTWLQVQGMAVDPAGNLIFSEGQSRSVWRIDSGGGLRRVAGTWTSGTAGEGGPAASAQLEYPNDLAFDASGTLYIRDQDRILKIGAEGDLVRVDSGKSVRGGVLTTDAAGQVYVTAPGGGQIFRLEGNGSLTSFAGTGDDAFSNGCGSAASPAVGDAKTAKFGQITGMAVDPASNLLVVDQSHYLLRQITPAGQVRTIAGAPPSFSGDGGPASAATLDSPQGIAFDDAGSMYIADTGNHRIRKVMTDGIIQSIAGQNGPTGDMTYECSGVSPDTLRLPQAVAVAPSGDVFIADTGNNRVLRLAPGGTLTRFAGTGTWGFAASPLGTRADSVPLAQPRAVGVDRAGNVWIGDNATRTLKVAPDGTIAGVLPRLRARSFSADTQGNLYLTSAYVVYQVMEGDQLVPVAGTMRDSQIPPSGTPPVNELDTTLDIYAGSGLTRDGQGTLYNIGQGGIDLISTGCHTEPGSLQMPRGAAHLAESPAGDVYATDAGSNVIWRLPHLMVQPGDLPTPLLSAGTSVQNAASMLVSSQDQIVPTGGFSSATIRYLVTPPIAPGEIVRINGQCLGPVEQVRASLDSDGRLPVSLAGVQITMAGLPVPLIAVQEGSIVAVTPFALPVNQNVAFVMTVNGVQIKGTLQTTAFSPGLVRFLQPDGTAAVAAVNQDGTLNAQANPAPVGSVVALYATGLGQTNPPAIDGQLATDIGARYLADLQVTINSVPGQVQYAGPAPGFTGLSQINVLVPQTTTGPVKVLMGNVPFQQIVQLWVR